MKKYTINSWFTLVELIVSIAIFGIIMTSVLAIFLFSSQMSTRVELNRIMQENIKNVMEDIAEGVRKHQISGISVAIDGNCNNLIWWPSSKFCIKDQDADGDDYIVASYVLWTYDTISNTTDIIQNTNWTPNEISTKCGDISSSGICRILKKDSTGSYYPLTNNFVHVEDLAFTVSNDLVPKVTVSLTIRPAVKKWLASDLVRASTVQVQTTISERSIKTK